MDLYGQSDAVEALAMAQIAAQCRDLAMIITSIFSENV